MAHLSSSVVAIGVFDGVHIGHQKLLTDAVRDAARRGVRSVAVTFDRDPDQITAPSSAAPQLLTLEDKIACLLAVGISTVLVVPFTPEIARTPAEEFLDEVLAAGMDVVAVHVGCDFRFGAGASGDVDTLYVWGVEHNVEVIAHPLVTSQSRPVSSTRIRGLVATGDVAEAEALLGRPPRVRGAVVHGRGEGAELGFPTANVVPVPYGALPCDGVYAAVVVLDDGERWPAAVSVGLPPTFPQAREHLEAHLIGFDGDLYDHEIALDFIERLRDQRSFDSLGELKDAIGHDVISAQRLALEHGLHAGTDAPDGEGDPADRDEIVDDPAALASAQLIADSADPMGAYHAAESDWVRAIKPVRMSGLLTAAGAGSFAYSATLEAAGIPFAWDPYPPESMPGFRPAYGAFDRPFSMLVPPEYLADARAALWESGLLETDPEGDADESDGDLTLRSRVPAHVGSTDHSPVIHTDDRRRTGALLLFLAFIGFDVIVVLIAWLMGAFD
jgi:riboflavin kinase/FMN adenylyltransferase